MAALAHVKRGTFLPDAAGEQEEAARERAQILRFDDGAAAAKRDMKPLAFPAFGRIGNREAGDGLDARADERNSFT